MSHNAITVQFDPALAASIRQQHEAKSATELAHMAGFAIAKLAEYPKGGEPE